MPIPEKDAPSPLAEREKEDVYQAYLDAEGCQDASNLSGVVNTFACIMPHLWSEARAWGGGTDYVNTHPVVRLFAARIMALSASGIMDPGTYGEAARKVGLVRCLGPRWMGTFEHGQALIEVINRPVEAR